MNRGSGLIARLGTCFAALAVMLALMPSAVWALELSADQKQKMKAMGTSARAAIESQRKTLSTARMDLMGVYRVYKLDEHKAQNAMSRIGASQKALLDSQLDGQNKIRQILNADQFTDFQKMISNRMRHPGIAIEPPFEVRVLETGLDTAIQAQTKLTPDQTKRVEQIKRIGQKRQEVMTRMRGSTERLAGLYSKLDLDSKGARKLVDAIHHDQMGLMWMTHRRQQAIRVVLTEDQFNQLQQTIKQKFEAMWHNDPKSKDRDRDRRRPTGGRK